MGQLGKCVALARAFWEHWPGGKAAAASPPAQDELLQLGSCLEQALARCQAAFPTISLAPETFVGHLAARVPAGAPPADAMGELHLEDLYLACACLAHQPAALEVLEQRYILRVKVRQTLVSGGHTTLQELRQLLRERLLMRTGSVPPRLESYSGQGALAAWIQVVAVRLALNLNRDRKRDLASEEEARVSAALFAPDGDPELDFVKRRYAPDFRDSFSEAMQALTARERYLLRLHLCDGLNIDRIGALEGVHRATAARWLSAARERLYEETCRRLQQRLGLTSSQLESLVGLLRSQLDVTVSRYLRTHPEPASG